MQDLAPPLQIQFPTAVPERQQEVAPVLGPATHLGNHMLLLLALTWPSSSGWGLFGEHFFSVIQINTKTLIGAISLSFFSYSEGGKA